MKSFRKSKFGLTSALMLLGTGCGGPAGPLDDVGAASADPELEQMLASLEGTQSLVAKVPKGKLNLCSLNPSAPACSFSLSVPQLDAVVGRGWNVMTDKDTPSLFSCLESADVVGPTGTSAPNVTSSISIISSSAELKSALSLSGRISGSAPIEGVPVSASIEGGLQDASKITRDTINVVASTRITFPNRRLKNLPVVNAGALATFDGPGGALAFRELCGDRFVDEVTPGAEFYAALQIHSNDVQLQNELKTRLAIHVGGGGGSGGVANDLLAMLQELGVAPNAQLDAEGKVTSSFNGKSIQIRVSTLQRGGKLSSNIVRVNQLIQRFTEFPTTVTSLHDTDVMGVNLKEYSAIPNFGGRQSFGLSSQTTAINSQLVPAYYEYLDILHQAEFALAHEDEGIFLPFNEQDVDALRREARDGKLLVEQLMRLCDEGTTASRVLCTASRIERRLPETLPMRERLPVRKQLYRVTAEEFRDVVSTKGGKTLIVHKRGGGGTCTVSETSSGGVVILTQTGLLNQECGYELFSGMRLSPGWDLDSFDRSVPEAEDTQRVTHFPQRTNLAFGVIQHAKQAFPSQPEVKATLKSITLVGPPGNPNNAWKAAIIKR